MPKIKYSQIARIMAILGAGLCAALLCQWNLTMPELILHLVFGSVVVFSLIGMVCNHLYTFKWTSLASLFYVCWAMQEAALAWLAYADWHTAIRPTLWLAGTMLWFVGAMCYPRFWQREQPNR